ncbi:hypothetical protein PHYPSEUDO_002537 [Phytophthora pseudosyringae]|uniref:PH domain-containing protein n=1 Tax=Phytophthora pseudosyringae TaxID=221518 RepID=A0A8T1VT09_9STRA|nr:hypothetical protein PHYPSEUDO_002537 [Phytophthora pseudosyringae]
MSDGQILRTGVLFKKGSGTGPFGRKNWKPRYFVLTPARLQYYTFEDGELKGELSLQGCDEGVLEVMPADSMKTGSSASTIWRIAVNAPERRLLVAAGTEMEMNDWVDKLVMAFRINSGQPPMQRASMPAPSSASGAMAGNSVNSNPSIRDFQNFSVPRRGVNQRHSTGAEMRSPSLEEQELHAAQAESMKQQRLDDEHRQEELRQEQQLRRQEEEQHRQAEQDADMRSQLAAQQQREQEEAVTRQQEEAAQTAALAAAEELQRQEEQQKQAQKERELQNQKEVEMQQAMELQRAREAEEAARIQHEQEQEAIRNQRLADEMAMQEALKPQQGEDLLELQRRQKREEHARQRAEREMALKLKLQQEQEQEDLAFRMTQQMNSHFSVDDESDDSDHEPEGSPMQGTGSSPVVGSGPIGSGGLDAEDAARLSASQAPATAPRSSLVGDVKREMIQKQQQEHQRRREAALKQEQQARDAEWRQQQVELEQQRAKAEGLNVREAPREVEVAPREIEVVRRAPVKKPAAPPAAPMESFEF